MKSLLLFVLLFSHLAFSQTLPQNGTYRTYYKDTIKKDIIHYKNGKREGEHIRFNTDGTTILYIVNYSNDQFTGELRMFYKEPKTQKIYLGSETKLIDGGVKIIGYHLNGNIRETKHYKKNPDYNLTKEYLDLPYEYFSKSKMFLLHGEEVQFNEVSAIKSKTRWSDGKKVEEEIYCTVSEYSFCNAKNNLVSRTTYGINEAGKKTTFVKSYNNGMLWSEVFYLGENPYKSLYRSVTEYYDNGNKSTSYIVTSEAGDCDYLFYWYNGQLREKLKYKQGILAGNQTIYYSSGDKMEECFENDSTVHLIFYHPNGKTKENRSYLKTKGFKFYLKLNDVGIIEPVNVLANGSWKLYDEKGNLIKEAIYADGKISK